MPVRRRSNDAEELSLTLGEEFFGDALSDMEVRHRAHLSEATAAAIAVDLEVGGPFGRYLADRRQDAAAALNILAQIDPRDAVGITAAQGEVREYLRAVAWIDAHRIEARNAEAIINEERRRNGTQYIDDE